MEDPLTLNGTEVIKSIVGFWIGPFCCERNLCETEEINEIQLDGSTVSMSISWCQWLHMVLLGNTVWHCLYLWGTYSGVVGLDCQLGNLESPRRHTPACLWGCFQRRWMKKDDPTLGWAPSKGWPWYKDFGEKVVTLITFTSSRVGVSVTTAAILY